MSVTPPEPAPPHVSFLDHVKAWFRRDIEPALAALQSDAAHLRELVPQVEKIATVVAVIAEAADPAAAPEIAAAAAIAKAALTEIGRIAGELSAAKM